MDDTRLPDLDRIRDGKEQNKQLPSQNSADDTSNWDDRAFSAPDIRGERKVVLSVPPVEGIINNPYLEQQRIKSDNRQEG